MAPTSGNDINTYQRMAHDLTYPLKRTGRACPALCPGHVLLKRIPLGQPPSLRGLRRPTRTLFGHFPGTMELSDFLCPFNKGSALDSLGCL